MVGTGEHRVGEKEPLGVWVPGVRLLSVCLTTNVTIVAFESLAVATVLPVVSHHLGDLRLYGWVFSAFFLSSLLGTLGGGALSDRRGVRIPLMGGLAVFGLGLLVAGMAPNMPVLVGGRVIQGFGAGSVPAAAYVAISRAYPERARPRMFAVGATAWVVPGLIGPAIAAQIAAHAGWRWVFLGLLPLTAVAAVVTFPAVAAVPLPAPGGAAPFSVVAPLSVTAGAGLILLALTAAGPSPASIVVTAALLLGGGLLLLPSLAKLTPPGTLRARPGLPAAVLTRGLLTFAYFAGDAYVTLTLTAVRHTSITYAGVTLTVATLAWTAAAWIQARVVLRSGPRVLIRYGLALVVVGLAGLLILLLPSVPAWEAMVAWGVGGFGIGLAYSPISLTTLGWASAGQEGQASAALQLTDVLGTALGTGAAGAAIAIAHEHSGNPRLGLAVAFSLAMTVALLALALSSRLPDRTGPPPAPLP